MPTKPLHIYSKGTFIYPKIIDALLLHAAKYGYKFQVQKLDLSYFPMLKHLARRSAEAVIYQVIHENMSGNSPDFKAFKSHFMVRSKFEIEKEKLNDVEKLEAFAQMKYSELFYKHQSVIPTSDAKRYREFFFKGVENTLDYLKNKGSANSANGK